MPSRVDKPEPYPIRGLPNQHEVTSMVVDDHIARNEMGMEDYGGPLVTNDGRYTKMDAYQEALDLVVYLKKDMMEEEHIKYIVRKFIQDGAGALTADDIEALAQWGWLGE
jgi:hypothetical protein